MAPPLIVEPTLTGPVFTNTGNCTPAPPGTSGRVHINEAPVPAAQVGAVGTFWSVPLMAAVSNVRLVVTFNASVAVAFSVRVA